MEEPHLLQRSYGVAGPLTKPTQDPNVAHTTPHALSMASISSEGSIESPIVEQEEIAALTHDVRNFKESLGKLRRIFNVDRDMSETLRVGAHERLGDVLRILRSVLEKYPALQASELLATAGKLIQQIKGYNYDDDKLEPKDLFEAIDHLALAFSSRVSEYLMGDLDASTSYSSSLSSKAKQSCENLVSEADSVCEMRLDEKKPDLLSPREIDSLLLKLEQGVDFALHRAKLWAKYAKDIMMYIEKRVRLEMEHASNLSKLAHNIRPMIKDESNLPLQSIYCTALDHDMNNSDSSQVTCSLLLGHKFLEPLSTRRIEHENTRKKVKELWYRELTQMYDAISRIRKARNWYQHWQCEWEKRRDAFQRALINTQDQHKLEKKKQMEDETLQRALEAETSYKACVVEANVRHAQLLQVKTEVVQQIRELIIHSDHVFKAATVNFFQLQHTLTAPCINQFQALHDSSQQYEPGSQYMEFVKQLPTTSRQKDTTQSPFAFEPSITGASRVLQQVRKSTDSIDSEDLFHGKEKCGHHIGSDTDSISSSHSNRSHELSPTDNAKSLARKRITVSTSGDELESTNENETLYSGTHEAMSSASETHTFSNLKTPSRCRECDSYVYFQGVDCSECGLSCHKKCLSTLAIQCGHKRLPRKMTTFGVDLGQHLTETTALVPHIICKCVDEIEKHGKTIKGIYRVSGVKSKVEKLCQAFENGANLVDLTGIHPNVIANVLKLYLRQLPEPLLTFKLYPEFVRIARESPSNSTMEVKSSTNQLDEVVKKLPHHHYLTLALLMQHLKRIADDSETNHMPPSNLGIVFGPTLLRTSEGSASLSSLVDTIHQTRAIEMMITCADELFSASEVAAARDYGAKWGKSESIASGLYRSFSFMDRGKKAKEPPEMDKIGVQEKVIPVSSEPDYQVELAETEGDQGILKDVAFSAHKTQSGTSSDDELSYFLLTDNMDQLKKSHSSSMPKIFKGSLKDYQGLEGVSLTLLGSPPPEASDYTHPKLCASMSDGCPSSPRECPPLRESSVSSETFAPCRRLKTDRSDGWTEPTGAYKLLGRTATRLGKNKLHSHHTESSADSDLSFESQASSSNDSKSPRELEEISDVFLEPQSMYCKKTMSLNTVVWEKGKPKDESQLTKSTTFSSKGSNGGDKFKTEEVSMSKKCNVESDPLKKSAAVSAMTLSHAKVHCPLGNTTTNTGNVDYAAYIPLYQRHPEGEDTTQVVSSKSTVTTEMHGIVTAQYVGCRKASYQSSSRHTNQVAYKMGNVETGSQSSCSSISSKNVAVSDVVRSQEVAANIGVGESPAEIRHATVIPVLSPVMNTAVETAYRDADGGEVLRSDKAYDYQTVVCTEDEKNSQL